MTHDPRAVDAARQAAGQGGGDPRYRDDPRIDPRQGGGDPRYQGQPSPRGDPRGEPRRDFRGAGWDGDPRGDPRARDGDPRGAADPRYQGAGRGDPRDPRQGGGDPRYQGNNQRGADPRVNGGDPRAAAGDPRFSQGFTQGGAAVNNGQGQGNKPGNNQGGGGNKPQGAQGGAQSGSRSSQPKNISKGRHLMRTVVRKRIIQAFGTFCAINSNVTTIYCFCKIEGVWRGDGTWSWLGITLGLIVATMLFFAQLAFSDWDSPGIFFAYVLVLAPDAYMTHTAWYNEILYPLFANSMGDPVAAVPVALAIGVPISIVSAYMSERTYLGPRAKSLMDRLMGRG